MVDSEVPEYQLSIPETWKTYTGPLNRRHHCLTDLLQVQLAIQLPDLQRAP
jgi:hypothetical protein